tara:strand:+ start:953 stop:1957 length:1005 start_codon:yes stop_codon:yes gene_type:complete
MEDIFQNRAKEEFYELFKHFMVSLLKLYPDSDELKKYTEVSDECIISKWYDNMTTDLNKKVKYNKAIERILKKSGIVFHVCEYSDIDGFESTNSLDILEEIDLFTKYRDMSDDDKKLFWKYISSINLACFRFKDEKAPYVPTREQIQENIKQKKTNVSHDADGPSMNKAFVNSLSSFCRLTNNKDVTENASDTEIERLSSQWVKYTQDTIDGEKIPVLCNQKSVSAFLKLGDYFEDFVLDDTTLNDEVWSLVTQLNGYSAVNDNIPKNMMGKIENIANRLADDIMNGRADLGSMNLSDIGQEVLSQVDEGEINQFASNIDNLIPALQSFQKGMR